MIFCALRPYLTILPLASVMLGGSLLQARAQDSTAATSSSVTASQDTSLQQPPTSYVIRESHSYWHTHGFDLSAGASGRYQQVVTDQGPARTSPSEGVGLLVSVREHPVPWAGIEVNYGYNRYSERYYAASNGTYLGRVQATQHEATAGYVFHEKTPYLQPFLTLGGGGLDFNPNRVNGSVAHQWRGAYMYEVGFDVVAKKQPHVGIRIQEHGLFYKAPDYYTAGIRSNGWIHQALPTTSVFYRF